ncbi:MAG: hypothetical protein ABIO99_02480 [Candidatus Limnocylindria bacterium]
MTFRFDPGRRKLLMAILGLAGSAALGPRAIANVLRSLDPVDESARALRALIRSRESAVILGRSYLAMAPGESDPRLLTSLIVGPAPLTSGGEAARLRERIIGDFAAGRTVGVDRWILSETEARLYALVSF